MWPMFPIFRRRATPAPMLIAASYSHIRFDPDNAEASFQMKNDGRVASAGSASPTEAASYAWLDGTNTSDYEVNATLSSGTTPSGSAVGSWLSLGTTRTWSLLQTSVGSKSCNLSVAIRPAGGGATIVTRAITLSATVDV